VLDKFSSRFPTVFYQPGELPEIARCLGVDIAYFITDGQRNESLLIPQVRNVIHSVFPFYEPHGDVYAYVSEWLSITTTGGKAPWVPHVVKPLRDGKGDLRTKLGIPTEAIVFGSYGRSNQFDIPFVHQTVKSVSESNPEIYFIFMNFNQFMPAKRNVIFLPGAYKDQDKAAVIDTCDAMLHGRLEGETFGLAIAEFSMRNKPVITYGQSPTQAHLFILGEKAIVYKDMKDLTKILSEFRRSTRDWNAYQKFSMPSVMDRFNRVFLEG
jgi:glycosyltransferase involved in cell wall biosynthesis